jgi:hypothetical protein
MPADARILLGRPGPPLWRLGSASRPAFTAVGDGCGLCAYAASADSSPERDHSAGSLSSASCGRDTGGLPRSDLRRLHLRSLAVAALRVASSAPAPLRSQVRTKFLRASPEPTQSMLKRRMAYGRSLSLHRSRIRN